MQNSKIFKTAFLIVLVLIVFIVISKKISHHISASRAFEAREKQIAETNACLQNGHWDCAEKNIRFLLEKEPNDTNLKLHLAGILLEQGRYTECIEFSENVLSLLTKETANNSQNEIVKNFQFLIQKSNLLIKEMQELGIENSTHFRLEFEGNLARTDIYEALTVLEVAYDSLCRLFDFYPENIIPLVLYHSSSYAGIGERPNWVGAVFDGKLRIPVNAMQFREWYRPMLFHELTHAFVRAMTRATVPLWINEGIAQTIDGSRSQMPRPEGARPSLKALTQSFIQETNSQKAILLYWYSEKMVQALLQKNNSFVHFKQFLQELNSNNPNDALKKYYSLTADELLQSL